MININIKKKNGRQNDLLALINRENEKYIDWKKNTNY